MKAAVQIRQPGKTSACGCAGQQHFIHEAIGFGFLGAHEIVTVGITFKRADILAGMFGQQLIQGSLGFDQFTRVNFNVKPGPPSRRSAADES